MLILIAGWKSHEDSTPTEIYIGTNGESAVEKAREAQNSGEFSKGFIRRFNLNRGSGVPLPVVPDAPAPKAVKAQKTAKAKSAGNEDSTKKEQSPNE